MKKIMGYFVSERESFSVFGMAAVYLDHIQNLIIIENAADATRFILMKGINIKYSQAQGLRHAV